MYNEKDMADLFLQGILTAAHALFAKGYHKATIWTCFDCIEKDMMERCIDVIEERPFIKEFKIFAIELIEDIIETL